jgi:hypothetical protein
VYLLIYLFQNLILCIGSTPFSPSLTFSNDEEDTAAIVCQTDQSNLTPKLYTPTPYRTSARMAFSPGFKTPIFASSQSVKARSLFPTHKCKFYTNPF